MSASRRDWWPVATSLMRTTWMWERQVHPVIMMINIAAIEDQEISAHDIKGAFLIPHVNQKDEPMYIRMNKLLAHIMCKVNPALSKFRDEKGRLYMRLLKYLYGLPQASYQFNVHLDKKLKEMGFLPLPGDRCAYTRGKGPTKVKHMRPRRRHPGVWQDGGKGTVRGGTQPGV